MLENIPEVFRSRFGFKSLTSVVYHFKNVSNYANIPKVLYVFKINFKKRIIE